jgi:polar amino acid transport system substrate-binding protein
MNNRVTFVLLALFALLATTTSASAEESTFDAVKKRGYVVAGVKNDYPPFGYINSEGKWVGLEVDMAQYIADKLGVSLKMEPVTSRTRIPMLVNGNIDLIMNLNPTRERAKTVDFVRPWFQDGAAILTYKGSGVNSAADLAAPRKTGAVQGAANGPQLLAIQPKATLVTFQEYPQAFVALKQRRVDAMVGGTVTLLQMAKGDTALEVLTPPYSADPEAIGVRYNDSKWRLFLEEAVMDAWADGSLAKMHEKVVGVPPTFTVELWPDYVQR